jgi:hypothetical protein
VNTIHKPAFIHKLLPSIPTPRSQNNVKFMVIILRKLRISHAGKFLSKLVQVKCKEIPYTVGIAILAQAGGVDKWHILVYKIFSILPSFFRCVMSKCFPHHPVFKHTYNVFFRGRTICTLTREVLLCRGNVSCILSNCEHNQWSVLTATSCAVFPDSQDYAVSAVRSRCGRSSDCKPCN